MIYLLIEWLENDLCDSTSTTDEDLQLNCIILTIRLDNQTLCLKKVSCIENHPFICQSEWKRFVWRWIYFISLARAMTENEFEENPMERVAFWVCLLSFLACIVDDKKESDEKKKQEAADATAKAIAAAEVQAYVNQCECSDYQINFQSFRIYSWNGYTGYYRNTKSNGVDESKTTCVR